MLMNRTYIGEHHYNKSESVIPKTRKDETQKYRKNVKTGRRKRPIEEWVMIRVDPIIDEDLFGKVQNQLALNKKFSSRNNTVNPYLLTGLILCQCGKSRSGQGAGCGSTYYRCTDRSSRFPMPTERECLEGGVAVKILDAVVWDKLAAFLKDPKLMQEQAERWAKKAGERNQESALDAPRDALSELNAEEERYAKACTEPV